MSSTSCRRSSSTDTHTCDSACRHALSIRLRTTRASVSRRPRTRPPDTCDVSIGTDRSRHTPRTPHRRGRPPRGRPRRRSRRAERGPRDRRRPARAVRPRRAPAARRPASRCGRGGAARLRVGCGSTRPGCAAHATRRTRTAVAAIDASSSRSSISFIVMASAATSSSVCGDGHPAVDGGAGDRRGLRSDGFHWSQSPSREVPREQANEKHERGEPDPARR